MDDLNRLLENFDMDEDTEEVEEDTTEPQPAETKSNFVVLQDTAYGGAEKQSRAQFLITKPPDNTPEDQEQRPIGDVDRAPHREGDEDLLDYYFDVSASSRQKPFSVALMDTNTDIETDEWESAIEFKCPHCPFTTTNRSVLKQHKVLHASGKPISYQCDICSWSTDSWAAFESHKHKHSTENSRTNHYYDQPSTSAQADAADLRHLQLLRSDHGILHCENCSFSTSDASMLNIHKFCHYGTTAYTCPECLFKTTDYNLMKVHQYIHTGDKCCQCYPPQDPSDDPSESGESSQANNNTCNVCCESYISKAALRQHKEMMHAITDPPRNCTICEEDFNDRYSYKQHMLIKHDLEVVFNTEELNFCTEYNEEYLDRKYRCSYCSLSFKEQLTLCRHEVLYHQILQDEHQPPTRLVCPRCPNVFYEMTSLTKHMGIHFLETPRDDAEQPQNMDELYELEDVNQPLGYIMTPEGNFCKIIDIIQTDDGISDSKITIIMTECEPKPSAALKRDSEAESATVKNDGDESKADGNDKKSTSKDEKEPNPTITIDFAMPGPSYRKL